MSRPLVFSYANGQWQAQAIPSHLQVSLSGAFDVSMNDPEHALAVDTWSYDIYAYGYGMQGDDTPTALPSIVTAPPATPRLPYPTNTPGVDCITLLKAALVNLRKLHSYHIALDEGSGQHFEGDVAIFDYTRYFREGGSGWQMGWGSGYPWLAPSDFENLLDNPTSPEPKFIGTEQQDGQTASHCQIVYKDGGSRDYWVGDEALGGLMHKMMNRQNTTNILTITYSRFNEYTSLEQLGPIATPTPFPTLPPQPTDSGG